MAALAVGSCTWGLRCTIAAAEARFGQFDAVIGHSFGGAALMVAAAGMLPDVAAVFPQRLVLIGSPSEMHWLFTGFGKMIGLGKPRRRCWSMRSIASPAGDLRTSMLAKRRAPSAASAGDPRRGRQGSQRQPCAALCGGGQRDGPALLGERLRPPAHRQRCAGSCGDQEFSRKADDASKKMRRSFRFLRFRESARHCSVIVGG
jgi:hypothetical protein